MMSRAFLTASGSLEAMLTVPSSSTSMATPVWSMIPLIVLPPGPMTRRIWSGLTLIVVMRGAYFDSSVARLVQRLEHLAEDEDAPLARLLERLAHDLAREAGDLDVHLDGGDAARRPADLEVHVAEVVLVAEDVAQDGEALAVRDEAHRDARDRRLDRHARVHERERPAAHRRHRRRAVRLERLATRRGSCTGTCPGPASCAGERARRARRGRSRAGPGRAAAWSRRWRTGGSCSGA